jgi:molybdenum cofactor biosynthesis protein MoaC
MIDISNKNPTKRTAIAEGKIFLSRKIIKEIKENNVPKGDVLKTAEIAGLLSIKQVPFVIPHCHPVKITKAKLDFDVFEDNIKVISTVEGIDRTGFEMESIYGVVVALTVIYDMCKGYGYNIEIGEIKLKKKTGGKTDYTG